MTAPSAHGELSVPRLPGDRPVFRLAGEIRVLVEENEGARTKDAGWVLALNGLFYPGSRLRPLPVTGLGTLEAAVDAVVQAWMSADKDAGGV